MVVEWNHIFWPSTLIRTVRTWNGISIECKLSWLLNEKVTMKFLTSLLRLIEAGIYDQWTYNMRTSRSQKMIDRLYRLTHVTDEINWDQIHYIKVAGVFMIWSAGITISIIVESILLLKNYNTREICKTILLDGFNRLISIFKLAYNNMKLQC